MKSEYLNPKKSSFKIINTIIFAVGILIFVGVAAFSSKDGENTQTKTTAAAPSAFPVEVSPAVFTKITEWDEYTGHFEASKEVEVRARVSGYLTKVNFRDGQIVKKGAVLFQLDDRPFKIVLSQREAAKEQALAGLKQAEDNFQRVQALKESGAVSVEEYDNRQQAVANAQATLALAEAGIEEAKLQLSFTKVRAPISGRVSRDRVNEGNLIDGNSSQGTLLTSIVAIQPIYFYFTGSESDYLKYARQAQNGERASTHSANLPIKIKLQDEEEFVHEGRIDFVDNHIDQNTGTIEERAILDNKDRLLEPGMFGKAQLLSRAEHDAILVPDKIIGTNQNLRFVYVLGEDNKVAVKNIELGPLHSDGLRIVRSGLSPDDQLIINNIQKIRPGMLVEPVSSSISEHDLVVR